jgi:hypothetical protein
MRIQLAFCILIFALCTDNSFAQSSPPDDSSRINPLKYYGIIKPNVLSTHPFGIFISRISHNFKTHAGEKPQLTFSVSNGNIWLPYVRGYIPLNESTREELKHITWYKRGWNFDFANEPSQILELSADGVIRLYFIKFSLPLSVNHELSFNLRSFSFDRGKIPFSLLTNDRFIEWFHSKVYGGENVFGRKDYKYDQAEINYTDENGKHLIIEPGGVHIAGIEMDYYYYPGINKNNKWFSANFGIHAGANTTPYYPTLDLGLATSVIKRIPFHKNRDLSLGLSIGLLHQGIADFGEHANICHNDLLLSFEGEIEARRQLKNGNYLSFGVNFFYQSPYNNSKDLDYMVLHSMQVSNSNHWHHAITHLYRPLQGWSFIFGYLNKKYSIFGYAREDLLVDNAPDVQTGIGFQILLGKSTGKLNN